MTRGPTFRAARGLADAHAPMASFPDLPPFVPSRPAAGPGTCLRIRSLFGAVRKRAAGDDGSAQPRRMSRLPWLLLGIVLGGVLYVSQPGRDGAGGGPVFWAFMAFAVGVIGLMGLLVLLVMIRPRHERVAFALKMARTGRVDWAIADIQRQIERRGASPERSGALGDCYLLREDWRQAYIHYLDAERTDGRRGRYLAKQGFALWKLGRAAEAVTLLERASAMEPINPSHAWTSCLILADLGREDEARAQLERAERLLAMMAPLDTSRRRALEDSIEICRKRLNDRPEAPPDPPASPV